ncbi:MAG: cob(I)yrinic acid a,c-diamide adenosyltransferase [Phycisphaerales bacterium]
MVKLTKIYTRSGDKGDTSLGTGKRVPKHDLRVDAYGCVDEANATLGIAVHTAQTQAPSLVPVLQSIQQDLFDVGADLCIPRTPDEQPGAALRVLPERIEALESIIDEHNEHLQPLNSFVLPGGSRLAAEFHVARTVCRRAERVVSLLHEREPGATSLTVLQYLNRLSDLLFVLSRVANDNGKSDVLWVPGKNRKQE